MHQNRFICSICPTSFSSQKRLNRHSKNIHGNGKALICTICQAEFRWKGTLRRHYRTMHDSTFNCHYCPAEFRNMGLLRTHLETHQSYEKDSFRLKKFPRKILFVHRSETVCRVSISNYEDFFCPTSSGTNIKDENSNTYVYPTPGLLRRVDTSFPLEWLGDISTIFEENQIPNMTIVKESISNPIPCNQVANRLK